MGSSLGVVIAGGGQKATRDSTSEAIGIDQPHACGQELGTIQRTLKMKTGEVVHIRVRPQDVMGAIDLIRATPIYTPGMSLASVIAWAFMYSMEAMRANGIIPKRDGFEYNEMLSPFKGMAKYDRARRSATSIQLGKAVSELEINDTQLHIPAAASSADSSSADSSENSSASARSNIPSALRIGEAELGELNLRVMSSRAEYLGERRNLSAEQIAKWLVNSSSRSSAESFLSREQIIEAEQLIRSILSNYCSIMEREQREQRE
jgi:hypothetical protein